MISAFGVDHGISTTSVSKAMTDQGAKWAWQKPNAGGAGAMKKVGMVKPKTAKPGAMKGKV